MKTPNYALAKIAQSKIEAEARAAWNARAKGNSRKASVNRSVWA